MNYPIVFYIPNADAVDGRRYASAKIVDGSGIALVDSAEDSYVIVARDDDELKQLIEDWHGLDQFLHISLADAVKKNAPG